MTLHRRIVRVVMPSSVWEEFRQSGHVLGVSCASYMLVCFVGTHLAALVMLDVVEALDTSVALYSLFQGAGNLIKGVLLALFAGPLMDRWGAHIVANATLVCATSLLALLTLSTTKAAFFAVLVALISVTAFAEQPTYVVIQATFFQTLQTIATSIIAAAYSASGAILPLVLAPACKLWLARHLLVRHRAVRAHISRHLSRVEARTLLCWAPRAEVSAVPRAKSRRAAAAV